MNKLSNYKELRNNKSLFDEAMSTDVLNNLGNPLDALSRLVDFEQFRPTLESALFTGERKSKAGRPPFDCVLMFKVLFLQRYYGLGDHQIQYHQQHTRPEFVAPWRKRPCLAELKVVGLESCIAEFLFTCR
jgi:IS5 family transposase